METMAGRRPSIKKNQDLLFGAGHTNGDSIIHFEEANIVHLGDLLFNRRHPYIDKSVRANISNWIKLLDKTASTFDKKTKYICGHAGEGYDILVKKMTWKLTATTWVMFWNWWRSTESR